jgi:preprotein translocase subunit YajC
MNKSADLLKLSQGSFIIMFVVLIAGYIFTATIEQAKNSENIKFEKTITFYH